MVTLYLVIAGHLHETEHPALHPLIESGLHKTEACGTHGLSLRSSSCLLLDPSNVHEQNAIDPAVRLAILLLTLLHLYPHHRLSSNMTPKSKRSASSARTSQLDYPGRKDRRK